MLISKYVQIFIMQIEKLFKAIMKNHLATHYRDFATSADLDAIARTVERGSRPVERIFWTVTCCWAAVAAVVLTGMVAQNYISGMPYDTGFNMDTQKGRVPFPDIIICTSTPWDVASVQKFNISADLLSYISHFLFPFGGFGGPPSNVTPPAEFLNLDKVYRSVLEKFNNNSLYLLGNITKTCSMTLEFCVFGISIRDFDCCRFFGPGEFMLGQKCFRTNHQLRFSVQEAGMINSIIFSLSTDANIFGGLNPFLLSQAAGLLSGQMSASVSDWKGHTFASRNRQCSLWLVSFCSPIPINSHRNYQQKK